MLIANFGRRFQGKTTLGAYVVDQVERRAILDPRQLVRRRGAVVVRSAPRLREAFDALAAGDCDEVVYSPLESHAAAFTAFAGELRRWIVDFPDLSIGVLIDEASFYPGLDDDDGPFMFAIKTCDVDAVTIVLTCHRPTDLPVDVRALCNRWALFRTTQEHDVDAVRRRCGSDVADLVQQLADREYVEWNDDDGTYDVNRCPYIWQTTLTEPGAASRIVVLQ
jgi:hypothetical protein